MEWKLNFTFLNITLIYSINLMKMNDIFSIEEFLKFSFHFEILYQE